MDNVEVHTVDGFEGREKKVIVFSTTRSNEANSIGFLADWRRMNVGLTRAKAVSKTGIREGISWVLTVFRRVWSLLETDIHSKMLAEAPPSNRPRKLERSTGET